MTIKLLLINNFIMAELKIMKKDIGCETTANKATRSPEISREQVQKQTPQFLLYIYWI